LVGGCGISAYLGEKIKIYQYLVQTLNILRSRGYDSAGICSLTNKFNIIKTLEKDLDKLLTNNIKDDESCVGMSHTRWATHGKVSINNTHPFTDMKDRFMLIHNGIITNAYEIRKELIKQGIIFRGETDSEVVVNLVAYMYEKLKNQTFEGVLQKAFTRLSGCWTICLVKYNEPYNMYVCNNETPCLIGYTDKSYYISSDFNTFATKTSNYIELNNGDIVRLSYNPITNLVNKDALNKYKVLRIDETVKTALTPYPYEHWLLKEIMGQPESIMKTLNKRNVFTKQFYDITDNLDNLIIIGSGTSYHAGMMGELYLREMTHLNGFCYNASEFELYDLPKTGRTGFLFISQSGETKDLYDIVQRLKKMSSDYKFMSITNSYNSLIPRNCDFNLYLGLTKEISVASTKTFTCSVLMLHILASKIAKKEFNNRESVCSAITDTLTQNTENIKELVEYVENKNMVFLSSSKATIPIVNEINLKFQEICYTYSLSSGAKNLKHGPLALITEGTPVFFFVPTHKEYKKVLSVANEVKSRGGYNILISSHKDYDEKVFDKFLPIVLNETFPNLMTLYSLQLMVYYLSVKKGINPDFPRNLAKCVTV
jgi:glucosamine--fructose-6-phosphate aminotransferase (isomerizing)